MEITVIGTGYAGLVTGVCLAELGHHVICVDMDTNKINKLKKGISPIMEAGLDELLVKNSRQNRLAFTTSYQEGLQNTDMIYIAVGTPGDKHGEANLTNLFAACTAIGQNLQQDAIIVTKSTVPIGTNERIKLAIEQQLPEDLSIEVVSNPEFLREGTAVYDTFHASRIVIGSENEQTARIMEHIYKPLNVPIVHTDLRSAEMIKYAANSFLAAKVSFINEMANLCERLGANIDHVTKGIGLDPRIGKDFLRAGIGYGGSCFPKDVDALISMGKTVDYVPVLMESVREVNNQQWQILLDKLFHRIGSLENKNIALLGLAFKPNTDDVRGSPAIPIAQSLLRAGAAVTAYDPAARINANELIGNTMHYAETLDHALIYADCAVIVTDWPEIKEYQLSRLKDLMKTAIIFDGRNCFQPAEAGKWGIEYYSTGRMQPYNLP